MTAMKWWDIWRSSPPSGLFDFKSAGASTRIPRSPRSLVLTARNYAGSHGAYFLNVCRYTKMIDEAILRGIGTSLLGHRIMTYVYQSRCGVIDEQRWESTPRDGGMSVN
jgi:hypothetical protein